jgi:two-component system chemotaxis sensor kinase CheA
MADPYRYFRVEAREILDQLQKLLLELEKGGATPDAVKVMLRLAHTLKGAARVVKQREIGEHSHALEDLLVALREDDSAKDSVISKGLSLLDAIEARLAAIEAKPQTVEHAPAPAEPEAPVRTPAERPVRTDVEEVGILVSGVQEVSTRLLALKRLLGGLTHGKNLADLVVNGLSPRAQEGSKQKVEQTRSLAEELTRLLTSLERELSTGVEQAGRELEQVHETAERLRLVPAHSVFGALERTARDVAHSVGKRVTFSARGGEIRLDAALLTQMQGALVQAVRNAVAHGVETPAERAAASKNLEGAVSIEVSRREKYVVFSCKDDGRGLDLEAVRGAAVARGMPEATALALDAEALVGLLLKGGISTASSVTAVAGRGVGLDLVRETTERLGGKVLVRSEPARGTEFELAVPATLAALDTLTVESGGHAVSLPLDAVRQTFRITPRDIVRSADGERLHVENELVPFVPLSLLLDFERAGEREGTPAAAVVIDGHAGRAALGVDRLLGTETTVARALPDIAQARAVVLGASLDAQGNPRLLLDPDQLVISAARTGLPPREPAHARAPILIVDDSLTTRMLEQSILESAGYDVELATSGEEGLSMAAARRYSLFLVDVEMPGMDGFTFVERTRKDPRFSATPAILVTSRASPDDLERGRSAGAAAHIVKSEFDQADFLSRIRRLLG